MKQSPSQQCKQAGLNSLAEVSRMTNVSAQTLTNWCKSKPQLFKTVIDGCMWQKVKDNWNKSNTSVRSIKGFQNLSNPMYLGTFLNDN